MSLRQFSRNTLTSKRASTNRFALSRVSLKRFPFPTAPAVAAAIPYIEDVFSTYLYTGNSPSSPPTAQTITNGINLADNGGLVWIKSRSEISSHAIFDTMRGVNRYLFSDNTDSSTNFGADFGVTAFNSNGFIVKGGTGYLVNKSGINYTSWTFRKQAKFFDIVTYTGNGVSGRQISHNLGSTPGCIIVKKTDGATNWAVYHRGLSGNQYLNLNSTDSVSAIGSGAGVFGNGTSLVAPTSSVFTVGTSSQVNLNGGSYIAYIFAHDAGGFGLTGSDNVITCGTYLGSNHRAKEVVTLGYEPQFVLIRNVTTAQQWVLVDNMRGMPQTGSQPWLAPNTSGAETTTSSDNVVATSTGFFFNGPQAPINQAGSTFIYIAIRRGPMKIPTSGTDVFSLRTYTGDGSSGLALDSGIVSDAYLIKRRTGATSGWKWMQRLISYPTIGSYGPPTALDSTSTAAESAAATWSFSRNQNYNTDYFEVAQDGSGNWFVNGSTYINYALRRSPGFFDIVCFTGTGALQNVPHNLSVAPELVITKLRGFSNNWNVWCGAVEDPAALKNVLFLDTNQAILGGANYWGSSTVGGVYGSNMTSSTFSVGATLSESTRTYVGYLFASCPGVSKVGKYTGTGALQTIDCGFTSGARFVLIKRTDSTGSWFVYDSARGITSGNDPYLLLNSTGTEATGNWVDTASTGFQVTAAAPAELNTNGGTYIFLAIA